MARRRGVLIYCGDVLGLGHQRRNLTIASRLVEELPDTDVLLVSSLPSGGLPCRVGIDVVKLPSLCKAPDGEIAARTLGMRRHDVEQLRRGILAGITAQFRADLVLVDHKPTGVWGELTESLQHWRASVDGPSVVLGMRDILDAPSRTVSHWRRHGVYRAIDRYYDAVLIYGAQEIFDTRARYRLDRECGTPIHYCGYVCPTNGSRGRAAVRRDLGLEAGPLAVVTAGGGADGYPMMKLCLDALGMVDPGLGLRLVCITGPLMRSEEVAALRRRADGVPARIVWLVDQLPALFEAADFLVTMAGYNTLLEAARLRKPTLVLPRGGPSAEQSMRAERLSHEGVVRAVPDGQRHPAGLAAVMTQYVTATPTPAELPGMDGLDRAVRRLCELLMARERRLDGAPRRLRVAAGGAE